MAEYEREGAGRTARQAGKCESEKLAPEACDDRLVVCRRLRGCKRGLACNPVLTRYQTRGGMAPIGAKARPSRSFANAGGLSPSGRNIGLAIKTERKPALCAPLRSVSTPSPMQRIFSFATLPPLSRAISRSVRS